MASLGRSRTKGLVLDVGTSAVRLCELVPTKTGYQLTKYFQREFGIDPAMSEEEQNELRLETLRALFKEAKAGSKKAIVGVPGQSVFMRPRSLPPVPSHKVNQIVRYEILQQIPFSIDQIAYDYQLLKRTEAGGYEVLMAAIKVEVVEKCLKPIIDLKRRIGAVDVCPLAAYNWLKHTGEFGEEGECVALIDLGASTTDIIIERENQFRFPRSVNAGGNDITQALAAEFDIPFSEAERLKRERGFAPTGDTARDGKGGEVIGQALGRLVGEISRSFSYFRSQPGGGPVSRVVLTGGGACLRNIVPYMQRELGVEVRIAQPLAGLVIAPEAQAVNENPEQASVVLGMALRGREEVPVAIDLIPPRVLARARRREQVAWWSVIVLTCVAIVFSVVPVRERENQEVLRQSAEYRNIIQQYDDGFVNVTGPLGAYESKYEKELQEIETELSNNQRRVEVMDKWFTGRTQWLKYMSAVNDARVQVLEGARSAGDEQSGVPPILVLREFKSVRILKASGQTDQPGVNTYACVDFTAPGKGDWGSRSNEPRGGSAFTLGGRSRGGSSRSSRRRGSQDEEKDWSSSPRAAVTPSAATPMTAPNGITINGYASKPELVIQFVAAIEATGAFVENGVYFTARDLNHVEWSELSTTVALAGSAIGAASKSTFGSPVSRSTYQSDEEDEDEDRGGFRGVSSLGSGSARRRSSTAMSGAGNSMVSLRMAQNAPMLRNFRLDLQFAGEGIPGGVRADGRVTVGPSLGGGGVGGAGEVGGDIMERLRLRMQQEDDEEEDY